MSINGQSILDEYNQHINLFFGDFLTVHGYKKMYERYDSEIFGNYEIIFQSIQLRLKFIRDRSQVFLEIGPTSNPTIFYDLSILIAFLKKLNTYAYTYPFPPSSNNHLTNHKNQINMISKNFIKNHKMINTFFLSSNYDVHKIELERFMKQLNETN